MKKLRIIEATIAMMIVTLASLMVFNFAYSYNSESTSEYSESITVEPPQIISPDLSRNISDLLKLKVIAPGALHAEYKIYPEHIIQMEFPSMEERYYAAPDVAGPIMGHVENTADGLFVFDEFPTIQLSNKRYIIIVRAEYPNVNGYQAMHTYKYLSIYNQSSSDSTDNTTSTDGTSDNTTYNPPTTIDEEIRVTKDTTTSNTVSEITDTEESKTTRRQYELPEDLKKAPISILMSTNYHKQFNFNKESSIGRVKLSGVAEPNTTIYLYIFSDPIVVSVQTDEYGNWEYNLDQDLEAGNHEVYVAVKDEEGVVKAKSMPYSFFVGEAVAASEGETDQNLNVTNTENYMLYYITFAVSAVAIIISGVFYFVTKKHIKKHESKA